MTQDAFWAPLIIYGIIVLVGLVIGAIGAGMAGDHEANHDTQKMGNGIAMLGLSIMGLGAFPAVVHLVGNCIEKCF